MSKVGTDMRHGIQSLEEKLVQHHTALHAIEDRTRAMDERTRLAQTNDHDLLTTVNAKVDSVNHSVVQTRNLGQQVMKYLGTFSKRFQGPLRAILQSNLQMYQLLLQIQRNIGPQPSNLLESNIRFEDALGEIKELPYQYFRHWEVGVHSQYMQSRMLIHNLQPFEGFLHAQFRGKPGEAKGAKSQYHIINVSKKTLMSKDRWTRSIREGTRLSMSMIMLHVKMQSGLCPRPGCSGTGSFAEGSMDTIQW